jgi:hypothetical protein
LAIDPPKPKDWIERSISPDDLKGNGAPHQERQRRDRRAHQSRLRQPRAEGPGDLLARASVTLGAAEKATAAARLAQDTVAAIAAAAPEPSLADTLWRWPRVLEMQETVERGRRM